MKNKSKTKTVIVKLDETHQQAVERLRNSKATLSGELRTAGHEEGRLFVLTQVAADALCQCRLKAFSQEPRTFYSLNTFGEELFRNTDFSGYEFAWNVEHNNGAEVHTSEWMNGFIEGALEKFAELEKHL